MWLGVSASWAADGGLLLHKTFFPNREGYLRGVLMGSDEEWERRDHVKRLNEENYLRERHPRFMDVRQVEHIEWDQAFEECTSAPFDQIPKNGVSLQTQADVGTVMYRETVDAVQMMTQGLIGQLVGGRDRWAAATRVTLRVTFPGEVVSAGNGVRVDSHTVEWARSYGDWKKSRQELVATFRQSLFPAQPPDAHVMKAWTAWREKNAAQQRRLFQPDGYSLVTMGKSNKAIPEKEGSFTILAAEGGSLTELRINEQGVHMTVVEQEGEAHMPNLYPSLGFLIGSVEASSLWVGSEVQGKIPDLKDAAPVWYRVEVVLPNSPAEQHLLQPQSWIIGAKYQSDLQWVPLESYDYIKLANEKFMMGFPVQILVLGEAKEDVAAPAVRVLELKPPLPDGLGVELGAAAPLLLRGSAHPVTGIPVLRVHRPSRAQRAGIQSGDIVFGSEDRDGTFKPLDSLLAIQNAVLTTKAKGEPLTILAGRLANAGAHDRPLYDLVKAVVTWNDGQTFQPVPGRVKRRNYPPVERKGRSPEQPNFP